MTEKHDKRFNAWLESRSFEEPSPDLAARIVAAARAIERKPPFLIMEWLRRTFIEFHLPRPAYAMAAVLLLGFAAGFGAQTATADTGEGLSGLLYEEGTSL